MKTMSQGQYRYRAESIQAAIQLAKDELGPEALILEVRRRPSADVAEGREGGVEIIAVPEEVYRRQQDVPDIEQIARRSRATQGYRGASGEPEVFTPTLNPASRGAVAALLQQFGILPPLSEQVANVFRSVTSLHEARAALSDVIHMSGIVGRLPAAAAGRHVVAVIGPSGVGKTTTIAKLAAVVAHVQQRRVALITTDTFRVGAIGQLRAYAEILNIPFYSAATREELQHALDTTDTLDAVFIDTAGVNPYNGALMKELRNVVGVRDPISCYLACSLTADFGELVQAAKRFSLLNPNGLIVTKVDETMRTPALVGLSQQTQLPLMYVCAGPRVPEDITLATPELLTDLLLQVLARSS
jgi:flagellar biosynthesis protein FlhF